MDTVLTIGIFDIFGAGAITSSIAASHYFFKKFLKQRAIEKAEEQKKKEGMKKTSVLDKF